MNGIPNTLRSDFESVGLSMESEDNLEKRAFVIDGVVKPKLTAQQTAFIKWTESA